MLPARALTLFQSVPCTARSRALHGLHGEASGREGAAGRHGAADSGDRGQPEPAFPYGVHHPCAERDFRGEQLADCETVQ